MIAAFLEDAHAEGDEGDQVEVDADPVPEEGEPGGEAEDGQPEDSSELQSVGKYAMPSRLRTST